MALDVVPAGRNTCLRGFRTLGGGGPLLRTSSPFRTAIEESRIGSGWFDIACERTVNSPLWGLVSRPRTTGTRLRMNLQSSRFAAFLLTFGLAMGGCVIHSSSGSSPQQPHSSGGKPAYQSSGDSRPASSSGKAISQEESKPAGGSESKPVAQPDADEPEAEDPAPKRTGGKKGDGPKRTTPKDGPKRTTPDAGDEPTRTNDAENTRIDAGRTKAGNKKNPQQDAGRTTSGDKKTPSASDNMVAPN